MSRALTLLLAWLAACGVKSIPRPPEPPSAVPGPGPATGARAPPDPLPEKAP